MKQVSNLILRKIGKQYMIVNANSGVVNMTDVFTLNNTAAQIWKYIEGKDFTSEELVDWLCDNYEVDRQTAEKDINRQLEDWKKFGLIK